MLTTPEASHRCMRPGDWYTRANIIATICVQQYLSLIVASFVGVCCLANPVSPVAHVISYR